jgi:hypothetical protein
MIDEIRRRRATVLCGVLTVPAGAGIVAVLPATAAHAVIQNIGQLGSPVGLRFATMN